jgi:hypothetical protein
VEQEKQYIKMIVKIHKNEGRLILAICDKGLLGKKFTDGNKQLDLRSDFYKGEYMDKDELKEMTRKAYIINAVGKKSVSFLEKEGLVSRDKIIKIDKVPHAQCLLL